MTARASATSASATWPVTWPVAGLVTGAVRSLLPAKCLAAGPVGDGADAGVGRCESHASILAAASLLVAPTVCMELSLNSYTV